MTWRQLSVAGLLFAAVAALYLTQDHIGPLFVTAAIVLITGEALIAVVDDTFPRKR